MAALTAAVEQTYATIDTVTHGSDMEQTWYSDRYGYSRQRWSKLGTAIDTVTHGSDGASLVQRSIRLLTAAMEQTWYNNRYGYSRQRWSKLTATEG